MTNKISPLVIVIFGATGDLTRKKLMPALFKMYREGLLGEKFYVVGVARRDLGREKFVEMMGESVISQSQSKSVPAKGGVGQNDSEVSSQWEKFKDHIYYQQGYFEEEEPYRKLATFLTDLEGNGETVTKPFARGPLKNAALMRYFYLATPPENYETILTNLDASRLSGGVGRPAREEGVEGVGGKEGLEKKGEGRVRILIEKPFGRDAQDAQKLEELLAHTFEERQIFRIDHYLGKEAIQNIIAFRFANGIFEPIWNKDYVDHVQITMAEAAGLEGRIGFYEGVGALRDVMQNHMLEMLALVAMEQPRSFSTDSVRDERARAIGAIRLIGEDEVGKYVVRGQYGRSQSKSVPAKGGVSPPEGGQLSAIGYREEKGVDPQSVTETYVAMKVTLDSPRWVGVPWYLRTGKRLPKDAVEISIVFKQTCHILFKEIGCPEEGNILTLRVSPNEGIGVRFIVKAPGHEFKLKDVDMNFNFKEVFAEDQVLEAYERVLEDVFRADQMLFNRSDEMVGSWNIITLVLKHWEVNGNVVFPNYAAGSWGPKEADELIERDGRKWILR